MRNKIFTILTLFLFYGCESNPMGSCSGGIGVSAPSLNIDENGYYHMDYNGNFSQTLTTLDASVGDEYIKVSWYADSDYDYVDALGNEYQVNIVNSSSYTNNQGIAHTVLGVTQEFIGDTVKVYAGFEDDCQNFHSDNIRIIIDE